MINGIRFHKIGINKDQGRKSRRMMKLKKLLKDIPIQQVKGSREITITGICANSKLVAPGNLFIAKKGKTDDGIKYIPEAIAAGACAVLTDIYDPSLKQVVQLVHSDVTSIEAALVAEYYQIPSDELLMIGLTGTNGKTTTSFLIKYLLDHFRGLCGLIGTIEYIIGEHRYQATYTTPDVISNHRMLREMVNQGCRSAVMEVTSHGLDQGRVAKIDYDIVLFSNLTTDHLDYHLTMDQYCESKRGLFLNLGKYKSKKKTAKTGVVNVDCPWHKKIIAGCQAPIFTYGIKNEADLKASEINLSGEGTHLKITYQGKTVNCYWPLIGRFNVYNCLGAIAVLLVHGISLDRIAERMKTIPAVKGRLEPVPNELGLKIYVDFAHSDDALANVLETLKELKKNGHIITVFGCGGNRDRTKRAKMAEASERYSTFTIVTSDNPRCEDPEAICQEIAYGFNKKGSYEIEVDRRSAIQKAIEMATPEDIVLIAGRGHETYQIFAHKTIEFDDCKIASEICSHLKRRQTANC
jgi:UDP-N-acetylmuramoyl-L-alanyl-D-glutamate--2,6-diaminopimelate ligase